MPHQNAKSSVQHHTGRTGDQRAPPVTAVDTGSYVSWQMDGKLKRLETLAEGLI